MLGELRLWAVTRASWSVYLNSATRAEWWHVIGVMIVAIIGQRGLLVSRFSKSEFCEQTVPAMVFLVVDELKTADTRHASRSLDRELYQL
jgi:hypothetical protein